MEHACRMLDWSVKKGCARRINAECYKVNIEIAVRLLPVHGFGELLSSAGSVGSGLVGRRKVVNVHVPRLCVGLVVRDACEVCCGICLSLVCLAPPGVFLPVHGSG